MDRATHRAGAIAGAVLLRLVDLVARRGHDADALCRAAGLRPGALREPHARVPYGVVDRLCERAVALLGDADLGLQLAQTLAPAVPDDPGALMLMASPTLRGAFERMVRHQRYWGDGPRSALVAAPGGLTVRYALPGARGALRRHADECALAEFVVGARAMSGRDLSPRAVSFRHEEPADARAHRALFRCPIAFGAAHAGVTFDDDDLDRPLPHASEVYRAVFEAQVERAIAALPRDESLSAAVRAVVAPALAGGRWSLDQTARALGVSARTMQRRLREEGATFAEVVDGVRREAAARYLDEGASLAEVAARLGYAEPSAFHHAYKRWTGTTPEQARAVRRAAAE